jgi:thiol-disulfide isomerase/thioredoxin
MQKNIFYLLLLIAAPIVFTQCTDKMYQTKTDNKGNTVYVGKGDQQIFYNHDELYWFRSGFEDYKPNHDTIEELKKWKNDIYFIVYAATWCDDTKDLLPKFYKTAYEAEFTTKEVQLYLMDRDKKTTDGSAQLLHIDKVPTIVVFRSGRMIGRIVETTSKPVEQEILDLIKTTW